MGFEPTRPHKPRFSFMISYALMVITGVLGIVTLLSMRSLILAVLRVTHVSIWAWGAIDKFSLILLAILWLIFVLFSQHYYERGLEKGALWPRFGRVIGLEVIISVLIFVGLAFVT
jgi:hypothetical protein